jgi:hypothetical protein
MPWIVSQINSVSRRREERQVDDGSDRLTMSGLALQQMRAFDAAATDRLLATVSALQQASYLPRHDPRTTFSADPDLHVLLAEGLGGGLSDQARAEAPTKTQAKAIRTGLRRRQRHA